MVLENPTARSFPKESEDLIEEWRTNLVTEIRAEHHVAAYLLVNAACADIERTLETVRFQGSLQPINEVRHRLLAVKFGLQIALKGGSPNGRFDVRSVHKRLADEAAHKARKAYEGLVDYVYAWYAYQVLRYGGYKLQSQDPLNLVFSDNPDWPADAEFAHNILAEQTILARTTPGQGSPTNGTLTDFVGKLDLNGISSDEFQHAWRALNRLVKQWEVPQVIERRKLLRRLKRSTSLPPKQVSRFVELITLGFAQRDRRLTLAQTPLVPLTASWLQVVPIAIKGANISTTTLRLALARGPKNTQQGTRERSSGPHCGVLFEGPMSGAKAEAVLNRDRSGGYRPRGVPANF